MLNNKQYRFINILNHIFFNQSVVDWQALQFYQKNQIIFHILPFYFKFYIQPCLKILISSSEEIL